MGSKESSKGMVQNSNHKPAEFDLNSLVKKQKNLEDDFSTIQNRFLKYQQDQKLRCKRNSKMMPKGRQSAVRKMNQQSRSRSRPNEENRIDNRANTHTINYNKPTKLQTNNVQMTSVIQPRINTM